MPMLALVLVDAVTAAAIFATVWSICVRIKNYGFLDVTWTLSIGLLALIDGMAGSGDAPRRIAYVALGVAWSLRLGLFILLRVLRHHPQEDGRYRSLRERWKSPAGFLAFFELQALIAVVFSSPFLVASFAGGSPLGRVEIGGLATAAIGVLGEALADWQASVFKRSPENAGKINDKGLWQFSRHPNYFFEILVWIGIALASQGLPWGWITIACPVLITYFLLRVTGIPLTEKHSLETHGVAFREYQRRTSVLIPWPRKAA